MDAEVTVLMMMKKALTRHEKNGFHFTIEMQTLSLHRMVQNICFSV